MPTSVAINEPSPHAMGTAEWIDQVYRTGPSRSPEGRSRPTTRFNDSTGYAEGSIRQDDRPQLPVYEGAYEQSAANLLNLMKSFGVIQRWKQQPFAIRKSEHGIDAFPDALCSCEKWGESVIEVKSRRFLSPDVIEKLGNVSSSLANCGLRYVLWTDKWPLFTAVRSNLTMLFGAERNHNGDMDDELVMLLGRFVKGITLSELRERGISSARVFAAMGRGEAFFNFYQLLTPETVITAQPQSRLLEIPLERTFAEWVAWRNFNPSSVAHPCQQLTTSKKVV